MLPLPGVEAAPDRTADPARQPRVQSVAKAANILFAVAASANGLKALEVAARLGLPRQATYHLLHTLVTLGMLTKTADNRYLLGLRIGALAEAFTRHLAPPERLLPYVRQVASETGETTYAVGWVDGEIAALAVVRGRFAVQTAEVPHGTCIDAHARASGKLLLAFADPVLRSRYLDHHPLTQRTSNTITDRSRLEEAFEDIRRERYATDLEEFADGVSCLSVPLHDGSVPFALSLSAPTSRFAAEWPRYLEIARRIVSAGH
jgi:DNA-binding IclR family transcriptional regulator